MDATKSVRTANGGLRLCDQCFSDINRKNPRVGELEAENARLKAVFREIVDFTEKIKRAIGADGKVVLREPTGRYIRDAIFVKE